MKAFMVKKTTIQVTKDLEKRDICTINTKINKIEISSLRLKCMMLSSLKTISRCQNLLG